MRRVTRPFMYTSLLPPAVPTLYTESPCAVNVSVSQGKTYFSLTSDRLREVNVCQSRRRRRRRASRAGRLSVTQPRPRRSITVTVISPMALLKSMMSSCEYVTGSRCCVEVVFLKGLSVEKALPVVHISSYVFVIPKT